MARTKCEWFYLSNKERNISSSLWNKPVVGERQLFQEPTALPIPCIRNENLEYDTVTYFLTNKVQHMQSDCSETTDLPQMFPMSQTPAFLVEAQRVSLHSRPVCNKINVV
jgi:hypothetical protein